jgi:large subunit ribosomal protein L13
MVPAVFFAFFISGRFQMSTYFPKQGEIARKWYVVDATGQTLGRLASRVANILAGKENPRYTPFIDTGDHVVVINAGKIHLTGMKSEAKVYRHYTGYPGGLREEDFRKRFVRRPELVVQEAIEGMLPKTKMGRAMAKKLKVYRDDKHPHQAQKPEGLSLARQA